MCRVHDGKARSLDLHRGRERTRTSLPSSSADRPASTMLIQDPPQGRRRLLLLRLPSTSASCLRSCDARTDLRIKAKRCMPTSASRLPPTISRSTSVRSAQCPEQREAIKARYTIRYGQLDCGQVNPHAMLPPTRYSTRISQSISERNRYVRLNQRLCERPWANSKRRPIAPLGHIAMFRRPV